MSVQQISEEQIAAMAVAAIAEETQTELSNVRIVSFREIRKSTLEQYIADHHIAYRKYQLGDEQ